LVDKGSPLKGFQKKLGLSMEDVKFHTTLVGFYRKYIEVHDEIIAVRHSDMTKEEKTERIKQLRKELQDVKD
jgi:hypothetical protein